MDHTWAGIPEAASEVAPRLSVGGLFVEALARRDFATLACCLDTSLTTGLEDPEKVTVAFLVALGAAEGGRPTLSP